MKPLALFSVFFVALCASVCGAAEEKSTSGVQIVAQADGTYVCTREATTTFSRDLDKLVAEAKDAVADFCGAKGKEPKILSITVEKPWMTLGFPKATVAFRALEPGDPAFLDRMPVPVVRVRKGKKGEVVGGSPAAMVAAPAPAPTDDLYAELTKLDDLRKKGILTDTEFEGLKKKVIERFK